MTLESNYNQLLAIKNDIFNNFEFTLNQSSIENGYINNIVTNENDIVFNLGQLTISFIVEILPNQSIIKLKTYYHERNMESYPNWRLTPIPGVEAFSNIDGVIQFLATMSGNVAPMAMKRNEFGKPYIKFLLEVLKAQKRV